jgi:hypothetical protein
LFFFLNNGFFRGRGISPLHNPLTSEGHVLVVTLTASSPAVPGGLQQGSRSIYTTDQILSANFNINGILSSPNLPIRLLAQILFNLYMSTLPSSSSKVFQKQKYLYSTWVHMMLTESRLSSLITSLSPTLTLEPKLTEKTAMKVNARVNLVRRLTGSKWGSIAPT